MNKNIKLPFVLILLPRGPVPDWLNVHHWHQKNGSLLLPEAQISRLLLLPGRRVSGSVPLANHRDAGGELRLCAFVQVSFFRVIVEPKNKVTNSYLPNVATCLSSWVALRGMVL